MKKLWLTLLLCQMVFLIPSEVFDAYPRTHVSLMTPDPSYDNRIEWDVRVIDVDFICRWYRRPGNHSATVIDKLHDPCLALAVVMTDLDGNQLCCVERSELAAQQLTPDVLQYPLTVIFVPQDCTVNYSLPYILDQEHGFMFPTRRIHIVVPEEVENVLALDVRVLTVDNMCRWYRRAGNHSVHTEQFDNEQSLLGCWVFNPDRGEYEFIAEGTEQGSWQLNDQTLLAAYEYPIIHAFI